MSAAEEKDGPKQRGSADAKKYDPYDFHVVGWDDPSEGPETPGYDEQIFSMSEQDWSDFVDGIEVVDGEILQPIIYRRNGRRMDVFEGRKRVIGARKYNERMGYERASDASTKVPGLAKREGDDDMLAMQIVGNECRINRTTLQKAKLAHVAEKRGWADERLCKAFGGIKVSTLKLWRKGLELDDGVLKLIERGEMKFHAALSLVEFPRTEQHKRALAMIEAGATTVASGRAQQAQGRSEEAEGGKKGKKGAARPVSAHKPPSKPVLAKLYSASGNGAALKCSPVALLEWVLGIGGMPNELVKLIATVEPGGKLQGAKGSKFKQLPLIEK